MNILVLKTIIEKVSQESVVNSSLTTVDDDSLNNVDSFCSEEVNKKIQSNGVSLTLLAEDFAEVFVPLISIGTVTNMLLTALIFRQIFCGGAKKRYLFLLCRAVVDAITCASMLIIVVHRRSHPDEGKNATAADGTVVFVPFGSPLLNAFVQFNFWILCSTYALLSLITFIAVRFPFYYRNNLTTRLCCGLLTTSIIVGICYSILCCKLGTTPFLTMEFEKPQSLVTYTPLGNPDTVIAIAIGNAIFILILWSLVIIQYIGVLMILIRLRGRRSDNRYRRHFNSLLKLSISIIIWTIMCALMVAAVLSPPIWNQRNMRWLKHYESLPHHSDILDDLCLEMASIATSLYELITISVSAESIWLARFVIDPFLCVYCDRNLRAFCAGNLKRLSTFRLSTEKQPI